MRRALAGSLIIAAAWMAFPSIAAGQDRIGVWFGAGGGYGSSGVDCPDCEGDRQNSGVVSLRGGWNLNAQTRIGVEYDRWRKSEAEDGEFGGTVTLSNVAAIVAFYPSPIARFFVKGGAGVAMFDAEFDLFGDRVSSDAARGLGLIAGAGYDIPVGRRWSVTPAIDFWTGDIGEITILGQPVFEDWKQNVIDFTVSITYR